MTFSISIRTMRRPQDYLRATLRRLVNTGAVSHPSVLGVHVHHGEALTPNQNGIAALRLAVKDQADWVIFLEDDIDVIDDFIGSTKRWLARFATPSVRAYPLGSFYPGVTRNCHATGVWEMALELYYGSQAVAMRTSDALDYANWLNTLNGVGADLHFDLHLVEWHREREPGQTFVLTPAPCFVDHVGEQSLMGTWERTGRMQDFAGRKWSYVG